MDASKEVAMLAEAKNDTVCGASTLHAKLDGPIFTSSQLLYLPRFESRPISVHIDGKALTVGAQAPYQR